MIEIEANGAAQAAAVCFDALRPAPYVENYNHLLTSPQNARVKIGDGQWRPLSAAMGNEIDVESDGIGLRFVNKTPEKVAIDFKGPSVFSAKTEHAPPSSQLKKLVGVGPDDIDGAREPVWEAARERDFAVLLGKPASSHTLRDAKSLWMRLHDVGLNYDGSEEFDQLDLEGVIQDIEYSNGVKVTGRWKPSLEKLLVGDEKLHSNIASLLDNMPAGEILKNNSVLAYQKNSRSASFLVNNNKKLEFWRLDDQGAVLDRASGASAIRTYEGMASTEISEAALGNPDCIFLQQLTNDGLEDEVRVFYLDKTRTVYTSNIQNASAEELKPLSEAIDLVGSASGKSPKLVLCRSSILRGKGGDFGEGQSAHALAGLYPGDPIDLYRGLQSKFAESDVLLANDVGLASTNLSELSKPLESVKKTVLASDLIPDNVGIIQNTHSQIQQAGFDVIQADAPDAIEADLLVLPGHRGEDYERIAKALASPEMKKSLFVDAACGGKEQLKLVIDRMEAHGLGGVLYYTKEIDRQALEASMAQLPKVLEAHGQIKSKLDFLRVWRRSIEEAINVCGDCSIKTSLVEMRDFICQLSEVRNPDYHQPIG